MEPRPRGALRCSQSPLALLLAPLGWPGLRSGATQVTFSCRRSPLPAQMTLNVALKVSTSLFTLAPSASDGHVLGYFGIT